MRVQEEANKGMTLKILPSFPPQQQQRVDSSVLSSAAVGHDPPFRVCVFTCVHVRAI